jgi:hypothetical protein
MTRDPRNHSDLGHACCTLPILASIVKIVALVPVRGCLKQSERTDC